jgi:predicted ATPase
MIKTWKLEGFKSVQSYTELSLAPLTIFAGANSSGKSTILQSILLLCQTLSSNVGSRSVLLNGNIVKLGQFDDLCSNSSRKRRIRIGFECQPHADQESGGDVSQPQLLTVGWRPRARRFDEGLSSVACDVLLGIDRGATDRELMQLQPRLLNCDILCKTLDEDRQPHTSQFRAVRSTASRRAASPDATPGSSASSANSGQTRAGSYRVTMDRDSLAEVRYELSDATVVDCRFHHFLPERLIAEYDEVGLAVNQLLSGMAGSQKSLFPTRVGRFPFNGELPVPPEVVDWLVGVLRLPDPVPNKSDMTMAGLFEIIRAVPAGQRRRILESMSPKPMLRNLRQAWDPAAPALRSVLPMRPPGDIQFGVSYITQFFSRSVKYLGPLRDEPKPLYPQGATVDPADVGFRGEFTAAVLNLHRQSSVTYLPAAAFARSAVAVEPRSAPLEEAVGDWARYMELADRFETHDLGKLGHEMKVVPSGSGKAHDLTHVGVGVSQALPILVMCLLADADTTLIFEQPELHLHPLVQSRLADFFLSMALLGKQCILETHSEYLVNRLRFRAAAALSDSLSNLLRAYFVEKKDGTSTFRHVMINEYGAVQDWPDGFFDQSQDEAERILMAATAKRQSDRARTSHV